MQKRKLGNSGLQVCALGFGCMGLNFWDGKGLDKKDAIHYFAMQLKEESHFLIPQRLTDLTPTKKLFARHYSLTEKM